MSTPYGKNRENFSTGITLFVNGAMISGDLIHPVAYLKGMSELLEVQPDKTAITIGLAMSEAIEARTKTPTQTKEGDNNKEVDVVYLKDIRSWNPPMSVPFERSFVALSIDAVDGFMWGKPSFGIRDEET